MEGMERLSPGTRFGNMYKVSYPVSGGRVQDIFGIIGKESRFFVIRQDFMEFMPECSLLLGSTDLLGTDEALKAFFDLHSLHFHL